MGHDLPRFILTIFSGAFVTFLSDGVFSHGAGSRCGRDRILRCIGRTGYPARKSVRKAPAQKARRGWLRVWTPRQAREADPSILFLKTRTPPKPMRVPAGFRTEEQVWAADPSP